MDRSEPTSQRRTLGRAVEIAGSDARLAEFLALPLSDVRRWAAGECEVPLDVFLALCDIVASNRLNPAALRNLKRAIRS